uniref:Uncharacterized protein n=1 Tax=Opuntia streptacantha TaxID=393608 RepID=A0A7C9ARR6_OPUST
MALYRSTGRSTFSTSTATSGSLPPTSVSMSAFLFEGICSWSLDMIISSDFVILAESEVNMRSSLLLALGPGGGFPIKGSTMSKRLHSKGAGRHWNSSRFGQTFFDINSSAVLAFPCSTPPEVNCRPVAMVNSMNC